MLDWVVCTDGKMLLPCLHGINECKQRSGEVAFLSPPMHNSGAYCYLCYCRVVSRSLTS